MTMDDPNADLVEKSWGKNGEVPMMKDLKHSGAIKECVLDSLPKLRNSKNYF